MTDRQTQYKVALVVHLFATIVTLLLLLPVLFLLYVIVTRDKQNNYSLSCVLLTASWLCGGLYCISRLLYYLFVRVHDIDYRLTAVATLMAVAAAAAAAAVVAEVISTSAAIEQY